MRASRRNPGLGTLGALLCAFALGGCAATPKRVENVARRDLDCQNVQIAKLDDGRYAASGCGRGAVYVELCEGDSCHFGRLRHGHEASIAEKVAPVPSAGGEAREVIAAPPPPEREVIAAPSPAEREIVPAPPPEGTDAGAGDEGGGSSDAVPAPAADTPPAPVPLSQGELSDPYEASVPERPSAQKTQAAPPEPLVEDRPPPPYPSHVWVSGYWWWGASSWLWVPGYWCPPYAGFGYVPGYWYWSVGYWWYWPGGWARPGTTIIVRDVAPRPRRIVPVRSFTARAQSVSAVRPTPAPRSAVRPSRSVQASRAFQPTRSPLLRYPSSTPSRMVRAAPSGASRASRAVGVAPNTGVGRVVRPGSIPERRQPAVTPRGPSTYRQPSSTYRQPSGGFVRPSTGARIAAPPSRAPASRSSARPASRPSSRPPAARPAPRPAVRPRSR